MSQVSSPAEAPVFRPAGPPFDDADADIVLRSCDGVDFRIYRVILSKASPIFKSMLALPIDATAPDALSDGVPLIALTEDSKTIFKLMEMCYPVQPPYFDDFGDAYDCLRAARKYEMGVASIRLTQILEAFVEEEPLRVFSAAIALKNKHLIRLSAKRFLRDSTLLLPPSMPAEFHELPASAFYHLQIYVRKCTEAVLSILDDIKWVIEARKPVKQLAKGGIPYLNCERSWIWFNHKDDCSCDGTHAGGVEAVIADVTQYFPSKSWWWKYIQGVKAELCVAPSGVEGILSRRIPSTFTSVAGCRICGRAAITQLPEFNGLLVKKIEQSISEVSLESLLEFGVE